MLSHTHGQLASPTTVGKELANFNHRLKQWHSDLNQSTIYGKMNGAVGNFNSHQIADDQLNWLEISNEFIRSLGLEPNPMTTQIEPHDCIARFCNALTGFNLVLLDFVRDFWTYISKSYFKLKVNKEEIGSSTMPHKVNPIDFENAEGNIGVANSLLRHFTEKLPVSRLQRDLSDSTVQRNLGIAIGHTLIAYNSVRRGLSKVTIDEQSIQADLDNAWEVLGEAVQTLLRLEGIEGGYEKVKVLTRGQTFDHEGYLKMIENLPLSPAGKAKLSKLTPTTYTGLAKQLTESHL